MIIGLDQELKEHCNRVAVLSLELAQKYGVTVKDALRIYTAAMLHDMGKAYLKQDVLNKTDRLTAAEMEYIKMHPIYSCKYALEKGRNDNTILMDILHHHEDYDGSGYPEGLKGIDIPLGARIIRIADYFDALTHDRVYRKRYSVNEAIDILKRNSNQLDPGLLSVFLSLIKRDLLMFIV